MMFRLSDWPIRRKLGLLAGVGALSALMLACTAFAVHNVMMIRDAKVEQITGLADILGSNAATALEFSDPVTAEEVLSSLRLQPAVEAGVLYDAEGEVLASYDFETSGSQKVEDLPGSTKAVFTDDGYLVIVDDIHRDGEKVGAIYLRSNLKEIQQQLVQVGWIVLAVMGVSMGVSMFITGWLQVLFTAPIHELASVMEQISAGGSSKKVKKYGRDELGVLCDGFNRMVDQIQVAHNDLQNAHDVLEERVVERTVELQAEVSERKQAEEAVLEAREFLETAVAQSPSGMIIADAPDVTIRLINEAAFKIRGGDHGSLKNIDVSLIADRWQIYRPDGRPYPSEELPLSRAVLKGEIVQDEELIIRSEDGTDRWVNANAAPLRDSRGKVTAGIVVFHDITERKAADAELTKTHQELLEVSRKAGMSEIATGVLHNVGNVLNSVNVGANRISEKVRKSRIAELRKAGEIVSEHEDDMANFVANHPQGKHMGRYVVEIGKHLSLEQQDLITDLAGLKKNIDHIKEIVAMQQTYARVSGVKEQLTPQELFEDALRMRSASLDRHQIEVIRDYDDLPVVMIDRHKVMQIIVNLLGNAKHAITDAYPEGGTLTLRLFRAENDCIRFEVIDNGSGITPENLAKIFNYGFTTKVDGHGFGLHTGALAAKEMGGALIAHSAGSGAGATFALEVPMHTAAVCEAAT